ncbi:MAG: WhiB family transcriptional regulator [Candidatus Saccharibacteria bacterium]|nr:WhiB family transcriptional regulator [Candidatus Saccharibacteria bacterium]
MSEFVTDDQATWVYWYQESQCAKELPQDSDIMIEQDADSVTIAKGICSRCVVIEHCRDDLASTNMSMAIGTIAGLSEYDRRYARNPNIR